MQYQVFDAYFDFKSHISIVNRRGRTLGEYTLAFGIFATVA